MAPTTRSGDERVTDADLDAVMVEVPKGALALAGIAVVFLLAG